ncbi:NUDIX domain-containing protein, partial [Candidatus Woesearchaeota archaeon]|nr:NUDIX domain-containing protein [Candidatus Woesearchaeota archaeon]
FELEEKVIDNISYFLVNNKINLPGKTKLNSDLELIQMFDHQNKPIFVDKKRLLFYRKDCSSNKRIRKKKILNVNDDFYHRASLCLIINRNMQVLVPLRSENKLYAGCREFSVAETLKIGETYEQGCLRGFEEERDFIFNAKSRERLHFFFSDLINNEYQSEHFNIFIFYKMPKDMFKANNIGIGKNNNSIEAQYYNWMPINKILDINANSGFMALNQYLNFRPDHLNVYIGALSSLSLKNVKKVFKQYK